MSVLAHVFYACGIQWCHLVSSQLLVYRTVAILCEPKHTDSGATDNVLTIRECSGAIYFPTGPSLLKRQKICHKF